MNQACSAGPASGRTAPQMEHPWEDGGQAASLGRGDMTNTRTDWSWQGSERLGGGIRGQGVLRLPGTGTRRRLVCV